MFSTGKLWIGTRWEISRMNILGDIWEFPPQFCCSVPGMHNIRQGPHAVIIFGHLVMIQGISIAFYREFCFMIKFMKKISKKGVNLHAAWT